MGPGDLLLLLIPLLVVVDPPASLGLFLGLTQGRTRKQRIQVAVKATAFASLVLIIFAATGKGLLGHLGIEIYSLQVAGGLLLVMIGLRMLREGREIPRREIREIHLPTGGAHSPDDADGDPSFVPLGIPMLAGPGAISLVIVQTTEFGVSLVAASIFGVMLITLLVLMAAARLQGLIGETGSRVITRIMGILTVAFAVQYILDGIDGWLA